MQTHIFCKLDWEAQHMLDINLSYKIHNIHVACLVDKPYKRLNMWKQNRQNKDATSIGEGDTHPFGTQYSGG